MTAWMAVMAVVLFAFSVWLIVKAERDSTDSFVYPFLTFFLGCGFAALTVGNIMVRNTAGQPIGEFHDQDIYKVVLVTPIADDSKTVVLGLRKLMDGRGWATRTVDLPLRTYRVPSTLIDPIRRYQPPFEIVVFKTGDTVSFSYHKPKKEQN